MKIKSLYIFCAAACCAAFASCEQESTIGPSLVTGDTNIYIDSLFNISGNAVRNSVMNAKSTSQLLGHIYVPEYGDLKCSFLSMMMPAADINVPDSIGVERIDSINLKLMAYKNYIVGDTLMPQQLTVYPLTRTLSTNIKSDFNPEGYYDKNTPLGKKNYTASALGKKDTLINASALFLNVKMPQQLGKTLFSSWRNNPETFRTPENLQSVFRGIYVDPSFGRGCMINISATTFTDYYYTLANRTTVEDGNAVTRQIRLTDSINMLYTGPEVVSSNIISFTPSEKLQERVAQGNAIVASPAGYNVEITFPAKEIADRYNEGKYNLSVVNNLILSIPGKTVSNDFGLLPAPTLLMVKTKDAETFFDEFKVPDNIESFYGTYDEKTGLYTFSSMRQYIINMIDSGSISEEDCRFTLIPISIDTETSIYDPNKIYVTKCVPYLMRPTLTELDMEKAKVKFTYSTQKIM